MALLIEPWPPFSTVGGYGQRLGAEGNKTAAPRSPRCAAQVVRLRSARLTLSCGESESNQAEAEQAGCGGLVDCGHSCDLDHWTELLRVSDWDVLLAGWGGEMCVSTDSPTTKVSPKLARMLHGHSPTASLPPWHVCVLPPWLVPIENSGAGKEESKNKPMLVARMAPEKISKVVKWELLLGIGLYYGVLAFSLSMTFWIGEMLMGMVGCFILIPLTAVLLCTLWRGWSYSRIDEP
ncbi:MAG: hypothetical protein OEZ41_00035 [Nitrospirota bacterium]|nr:hypothetical protein [Nitrospirota bacterium]MDH5698336.1 hypothetical protein [Nitrospirota bacterium]